jgi:streptomycin 6-kinase
LVVGEPFDPGGETSWVAPATHSTSGAELVLKIGWRHTEAVHEADGLRAWKGNGAVRLHAAADYDRTLALLLERCVPGTPLFSLAEEEQDPIIVGLIRRLWINPGEGHSFRPLQLMCDEWADEFEQKMARGRVSLDPSLALQGIELFRTLPAGAEQEVLLCTDLHAGNVLASERESWLMIDPKPYPGDPAYDMLQHLLNCQRRLLSDPRRLVQRVATLARINPDRLLLWLFARCVQESPNHPTFGEVAHRIAPG